VLSSSYFIMGLAHWLIFLPAFALSSKDSVAIVPAEDLKVCEYFDARIIRLGEIINEELRPDVDVHSDLYITLEESKLCDTVGYVAIPECVAKNEGDECVARKTSEMITKSLRAAMKAEKIKEVPTGEKFFATCKHIGYKNVLKTFKSARSLMSAECGLPGQKLGNRHARNADLLPALLLAGSYDPSSIWFQYFLCKDIDLYCYFFTQGWTQGQYGQYYLYDNLFDDNTGLFAGSSDSSNLATIALLGGLGGGYSLPTGYYPTYGAQAPTQRKRRGVGFVGDESDEESDDETNGDRRKRGVCADGTVSDDCSDRKRRDSCEEGANDECNRKKRSVCPDGTVSENCDRKRREEPSDEELDKRQRTSVCDEFPGHKDCPKRKRRTVDCNVDPSHKDCPKRERRTVNCKTDRDHPECRRRKRRSNDTCSENESDDSCRMRRQACEDCENNPDSTKCDEC